MASLDHLSYSSVSSYQLCGRAWRFKYVDKIQVPASPSLVFGSAFHGTLEALIRRRYAEPENVLWPVAEVWPEHWTKTQQQEIDWQGEVPEELSNLGLRMLSHKTTLDLLDSITPQVDGAGEPVIELRVELRVPGVPIPVIGFIDLITADGVPCDIKTSARAWSQEKAAEEMQPLFYHAALNQMGYTQNPTMTFRHYVFTKTRTPSAAAFETRHTPAQLFWLFGAIREVWRAIDAGVFPPNPGSWLCSERWCSYYKMCRGKR